MALLHCTQCYHEWEGLEDSKGAWCGNSGYTLEKETGLELWIKDYYKERVDGKKKCTRNRTKKV